MSDDTHLQEICALNQTISSLSYQLSRAAERENILRKELADTQKASDRAVRNALGQQREAIASAIEDQANPDSHWGQLLGYELSAEIARDFELDSPSDRS